MQSEYHYLKNEMQELMKEKKNVERFLSDEEKGRNRKGFSIIKRRDSLA